MITKCTELLREITYNRKKVRRSNIIQRDNQKFARKLNKDLVKLAKERAVLVSMKFDFDKIKRKSSVTG